MKVKYALAIEEKEGYSFLENDGMKLIFDDIRDARREREICAHPENILILKVQEVRE